MPSSLKDLYLLDPNIVFLNHGSFGARPRPVFEDYQRWQRELERQPVDFLGRRARAAGLLTIVDGAHAPSQLPLDLHALDPDFYTGACHN